MPELAPAGWLFSINDSAKFNRAYRAQLHRIGHDEVLARIDTEIEDEEMGIDLAEAMLRESDPVPNMDSLLDFYSELLNLVQGHIRVAPRRELNDAPGGRS
jgi:hypothetical protein